MAVDGITHYATGGFGCLHPHTPRTAAGSRNVTLAGYEAYRLRC